MIIRITDLQALWGELDMPGRYLAANLNLDTVELFYSVSRVTSVSDGRRPQPVRIGPKDGVLETLSPSSVRHEQVAIVSFEIQDAEIDDAVSSGLLSPGPWCSTWVLSHLSQDFDEDEEIKSGLARIADGPFSFVYIMYPAEQFSEEDRVALGWPREVPDGPMYYRREPPEIIEPFSGGHN